MIDQISASAPFSAAPRPAPAPDLLMVEPDDRVARLIEGFLEERGWKVTRVADVRSALRALDDLSPQMIVTELDGEDLDGFALLDAVAAMNDPPPVLVSTRHADDALIPEALRSLGISVVLPRPCRLSTLAAALDALLEQRRAEPPCARERRALALEEETLCHA